MKLIRYLTLTFIDGFGITHPSMEERDHAAKYIAFLMIGIVVTICLAFFVGLHLLHG